MIFSILISETLPPEKKKYAQKPTLLPTQRYNEDKTGFRTGVILSEQVTNVMLEEVQKSKNYINKKQVDLKIILTIVELQKCIDNLRGAMMIAYPGYYGLEEYEPARVVLEGKFDFEGLQSDVYDVI